MIANNEAPSSFAGFRKESLITIDFVIIFRWSL
jgi:hypothetical protein